MDLPDTKNFYAMALKRFFQNLGDNELELLCHNYVHNWINQELQSSNRLLSKYQVEQKLEYVKRMGGSMTNRNVSTTTSILGGIDDDTKTNGGRTDKSLPRYMEPTYKYIKRHEE